MHFNNDNNPTKHTSIFRVVAFILGLSVCLLNNTANAASKTQVSKPDDILGWWKVIDDKTGFQNATCEITRQKNGKYMCRLIRLYLHEGYKLPTVCVDCPKPFTDKRMLGMTVMWDLQADKKRYYKGAYGIDPLSGVMYRGRASLSKNKRMLRLRASPLGTSLAYRTIVWMREDKKTAKCHPKNCLKLK